MICEKCQKEFKEGDECYCLTRGKIDVTPSGSLMTSPRGIKGMEPFVIEDNYLTKQKTIFEPRTDKKEFYCKKCLPKLWVVIQYYKGHIQVVTIKEDYAKAHKEYRRLVKELGYDTLKEFKRDHEAFGKVIMEEVNITKDIVIGGY